MNLWNPLQAVDTQVLLLINRSLQNPLFDVIMPILSTKRYALLPAAVMVLMLLVWGGRRMWLLVGVGIVVVAVSDWGATLLKAAVQRPRPCHVIPGVHLLAGCTTSFALPSNHATNMFSVATVAWLALPRWRWGVLGLAIGVAYSRVYLGVHYPGDALAGALMGAVIGWTGVWCAAQAWPGAWGQGEVRNSSRDQALVFLRSPAP